jgi:phosphoribosylanthranilate isomerase
MTAPAIIVKVCGLTRLADARDALEAGADWLGFVIHADSPRAIAPEHAAAILAALPGATGVAVMAGVESDQALALARRAGAARVQLHRCDPAAWPLDFPLPAAFAVPVAADGRLTAPAPDERHLLMLDTADAARDGGTGRTFPWTAAAALAARRPVMLAGGLDGDNVGAALDAAHPFGVDASSRLEIAPGIKDPGQVRRFLEAVRHWSRMRGGE